MFTCKIESDSRLGPLQKGFTPAWMSRWALATVKAKRPALCAGLLGFETARHHQFFLLNARDTAPVIVTCKMFPRGQNRLHENVWLKGTQV